MDAQQHRFNYLLYAWFLWLVIALYCYFAGGVISFASIAENYLLNKFHTTEVGLSFLPVAFLYSYLVLQIIVGILYDRFNSRWLLGIAIVAFIIGLIIFNITTSLLVGILAMFFMGFGSSFAFVGALYVATQWLPKSLHPIAAALTTMCSQIAVLTFGLGFSIAIKHYSWPEIFWFLVLVAVIIFLLNIIFVRDKPSQIEKVNIEIEWHKVRKLLKNSQIWLAGLYVGLGYVSVIAMVSIWRVHVIEHVFKEGTEIAVLTNGFGAIGMIIGSLVFGLLLKRLNKFKRLMLIGAAGQFICLLFGHYIVGQLDLHVIFFFGLGFFAASATLVYVFSRRIALSGTEGFALGFMNMFSMLISIIILPLMAFILEKTHQNFYLAVVPIVVCIVIEFIVALFIKEPK